ncbi:hypothetical protein GBZ26_21550 [Azospirillum formosense]|uniref:Uncharacterized protein n=1 Tax=Azospirillum formosense TaxID=861533 RepID=A0ABX2KYM3_9PROT|nr:hypothetical protein [Azospirillum formosense]
MSIQRIFSPVLWRDPGSHRRRDAPGTRKSETPARGAGVSAVVPGHPQWLSRLNGNVQKCVAEQVGFLK